MNKRSHQIGSMILSGVTIVTSYYIDRYRFNIEPFDVTMVVAGIMIGGFLPDIDAEHSYIRSKVPIVAKIYDIFPKNFIFRHRGLMWHSIYTILAFLIVAIATPVHILRIILYGVAIGISGHHILDSLTPMGLKLYFFPWTHKSRR